MMKAMFLLYVTLTSSAFAQSEPPACNRDSGNAALILIDMQPKFVMRGGNHETAGNKTKVEQIIAEQVAAINQAKRAKIPVIFLEYEGDYGATNGALRAAVGNYNEVRMFIKTSDGMFENNNSHKKELADYLLSKEIGTLIITGANGGACVRSSISGALNNNCLVVAYSKGIADFNYREFIYPYVGQYTDIGSKCKECSYEEVTSINELSKLMVKTSNRVRVSPTSGKSSGVAQ